MAVDLKAWRHRENVTYNCPICGSMEHRDSSRGIGRFLLMSTIRLTTRFVTKAPSEAIISLNLIAQDDK
jgi:hypothetical protein